MGEGFVRLKIDKKVDLKKYKLKLNTAIRQSWKSFPDGLQYPVFSSTQETQRDKKLITYRLSSVADISFVHNWITSFFNTGLLKIKGYKEINIDGLYGNEVLFNIQKEKIDDLKIDVIEIKQAISNYAGQIDISPLIISKDTNSYSYILRIYSDPSNSPDFSKIPVKKVDGRIIFLCDIAEFSLQNTKANTLYRVNGDKSIFISIVANDNENDLIVAARIKKYVNSIKADIPENITLELVADSTEFIKDELVKISLRTIIVLILLFLTIWLIYKDKNYILIIAVSFFVNIAIASLLYYFLEIEIHYFAMAGITLSFGMMIDNSIIVIDYIRKKKNKRIILPLFAATLTTIGALYIVSIIPVEKEDFWYDFTMVIIINLVISFANSLIFVPALISKLPLKNEPTKSIRSIRQSIYFESLYIRYISWATRHKKLIIVGFIWLFGVPFFVLPDKIDSDSYLVKTYNILFSNKVFREKIRPWMDAIIGGTFKPFYQIALNDYQSRMPEEENISIYAELQKEYRLDDIDKLISGLESFLEEKSWIKNIETQISFNKEATVTVLLMKDFPRLFPYALFDDVVSYLQKFGGGADWSIKYKEQQVSIEHEITRNKVWGFYIYGYNYEKLIKIAQEIKSEMLRNPRVRNISIDPEFKIFGKSSALKTNIFQFNDSLLQTRFISKPVVIESFNDYSDKSVFLGKGIFWNTPMNYYLKLDNEDNDYYYFMNKIITGQAVRLKNIGNIIEFEFPSKILRYNQQYQLYINYDFISSPQVAKKFENEQIQKLNYSLPQGYSAAPTNWRRAGNNAGWILILSIIVVCIFFITSALFESLKQAFWVVVMIPFSYIGVFITFWIFHIQFDQGGFASLVILGGTTVNASIYIINAMNNQSNYTWLRRYIKANRIMFIPIVLTTISTIIGFLPFIVGNSNEVFWKSLAAGTIGGLIFSVPVIFLLLPIGMNTRIMSS